MAANEDEARYAHEEPPNTSGSAVRATDLVKANAPPVATPPSEQLMSQQLGCLSCKGVCVPASARGR